MQTHRLVDCTHSMMPQETGCKTAFKPHLVLAEALLGKAMLTISLYLAQIGTTFSWDKLEMTQSTALKETTNFMEAMATTSCLETLAMILSMPTVTQIAEVSRRKIFSLEDLAMINSTGVQEVMPYLEDLGMTSFQD